MRAIKSDRKRTKRASKTGKAELIRQSRAGRIDSPSREGLEGIEKSGQQWPLFPRKIHDAVYGDIRIWSWPCIPRV